MAVGYLLAKAGDTFFVMPEQYYRDDYLSFHEVCKKNLEKLKECVPENADTLPTDILLETYDYQVQYDEKTKTITKVITDENGELQKKDKKVYLLANFSHPYKNTKGVENICVKPINDMGDTLSGCKSNFESNEDFNKNDLFLCCLYFNKKSNRKFIGNAKKIGTNVGNKIELKADNPQLAKQDKVNLSEKIDGEVFYQDAHGNDLRFGVLSGFYIANKNSNNITEVIIDDKYIFPVSLLSKSLARTWKNNCVNNTDNVLYKMLVAYYVNDSTKKITKVVDACEIADTIIDKETDGCILWQSRQFAEEIIIDKTNKTNAIQVKIIFPTEESVNAELIGRVRFYTGEDKVVQKRIRNIFAGEESINPRNEYFWFRLIKIKNQNEEIRYEVLDMKGTKEQVGTIVKDGFEESAAGRIYYNMPDPETGNPLKFFLAEIRTEKESKKKLYGWTELCDSKEEEQTQSIKPVNDNYKNFLDRAVEMSSYYAGYENKWNEYINYKKYEPLQFTITKDPNTKVDIQGNIVELRTLVRIDKVCEGKNALPYCICCNFPENKDNGKNNFTAFSKDIEDNCEKTSFNVWQAYFFAAHTNAERLFTEEKKNFKREWNIALQLKKIFIKGMDFSTKFDENFYKKYENISFEQWAADIPGIYIEKYNQKNDDDKKVFKEWMLQSILNLHTYFSYDLVNSFKNKLKNEDDFETYLGVKEAELNTLLELVWRREVILNAAKSITERVEEIKGICDTKIRKDKTFADFAYDESTLCKWNSVCEYVLVADKCLVTEEQYIKIANLVKDLKNNPNKAIAEIVFRPFPKSKDDPNLNKELFYGLIVAPPELTVDTIVDKEIYNTQEYLRISVTNVKQSQHILTRMPAYITKVEATVSWQDGEETILTPIEYETNPIKIAGGETKVLNLSLDNLKKKSVLDNLGKELSISFTITYKGDYFTSINEIKSIEISEKDKQKFVTKVAGNTWKTIRDELKKVGDEGDDIYFENKYLADITTDDKQNFFGRKKEIKKIADWILCHDIKHICISGQKQCGKSSLCKHIFDFKGHSLKTNHLFYNGMKTLDSYTDVVVLYYRTVSHMCKSGYTSDNVIARMKSAIVTDLMEVLKKNYSKERLEEKEFKDLLQKYESISLDENQIEQLLKALPEEVSISINSRKKEVKYIGGALRLFTSKLDEMDDENFNEWMKKFNALMESENKKYKIIVAIDEFTNLCKIEEGNIKLKDILEEILVNGFASSDGVDNIYVLAIGHEAMRIQLDKYITHNGIKKQYRYSIELKDLELDDVKDLIVKAFGLVKKEDLFNLFTTNAFNKLWELSGGNAPILKLILFQIYSKYRIGKFGSCITENDVISETNEFILGLGKANDIFDPFFNENSEDTELNNAILNFLMKVAIKIKETGCCKRNDIVEEKYIRFGEEQERSLYEILLERDILIDNEEIKIKVGVLTEYLYQVYKNEFKEKRIITWKRQN